MLKDHDDGLKGIKGEKFVTGCTWAHRTDEVEIEGSRIKMDKFNTEDWLEVKKALNSLTQRCNLNKKHPRLVKMMKERKGHMEVRANSVIFRKCIPEKGSKLCSDCQANPHQIPQEVLADLPELDLGGGALWWDLTLDPEKPGVKALKMRVSAFYSQVHSELCFEHWRQDQTSLLTLTSVKRRRDSAGVMRNIAQQLS